MRLVRIMNLKNVCLCIKYTVPIMAEHGGGSMANVPSIAALSAAVGPNVRGDESRNARIHPEPGVDARRYGDKNELCLSGYMDTPMARGIKEGLNEKEQKPRLDSFAANVPFSRVGEAREVADAICYLLSDRSSFMTPQHIVIDGGFVIRP